MNTEIWTPENIYGEGAAEARSRFEELRGAFARQFGRPAERFYRAPGRVELGGNHTDHQGGVTLSAAVDLDMIAAAAPRTRPTAPDGAGQRAQARARPPTGCRGTGRFL